MRIDIYSDTVCPWCYLGKRRFELALAARPQHEPRVTWRPFELNPDMPAEGVDRAIYLAGRIGPPELVAEAHAELGRQGRASRRSHLLMAHAARRGRQTAVMDRVMRAYFEEGCDIGDTEVLVRLGVEAGLPEYETRSALVLRAGQDGVIAAERHAAVLGITGVPTFVFDGQYTISGAQEVGTFARVIDQVADFAAARDEAS